MFGAYFSAVLVHGVWNACAVGAGFSVIGELIGKPEWLFTILPAMAGGMFVLIVGMFLVLVASNKKLKISSAPPAVPFAVPAEASPKDGGGAPTESQTDEESR